MKIREHLGPYHNRNTKIELTGNELATAVDAYLMSHNIHVQGPRTIVIHPPEDAGHTPPATVIVDPSGKVFDNRSLMS